MAVDTLKEGMWVVHTHGGHRNSYADAMKVVFDGKPRKVMAASASSSPRRGEADLLGVPKPHGAFGQNMWTWDLDCFTEVDSPGEQKAQNGIPEPFNDGKYLHYTRFHPQLQDMIGTEGYFYDDAFNPSMIAKRTLSGTNKGGYPLVGIGGIGDQDSGAYAYFAVPIEKPKTEITLQEIADKFGVDVERLRIKE